MKRLTLFLFIFGGGCLFVGMLLRVVPTDLGIFQKMLQAIGSYGSIAPRILEGLQPALWISGALLVVLAGVFAWANRRLAISSPGRRRWLMAAVIGLQLTVATIYIALMPYHTIAGDDGWYYHQANHLATGAPIIWNHAAGSPVGGEPTAYWPIGYPIVLSLFFRLFGSHLWAGQILNLILLPGIALITYFLAKEMSDPFTATRATLVAALTPSLTLISLALLSDLLFTFIFLLLIFLAVKKSSIVQSVLLGICYGLAVLIRPIALFLPILFFIYWLKKNGQVKTNLIRVAWVFALGEMVLLPWQIHNYRTFGQFVTVSNNGGQLFWMGNNPYTPCHGPMTVFIASDDTLELMKSLNEAQRDKLMFKIGLDYALSHPLRTVSIWPKKLFYLYFRDSQTITWALLSYPDVFPPAMLGGLYFFADGFYYALGLASLLSLIGIWRWEKFSPRWTLIAGTLVYFSLIFLPFITESRYHLPLLPLFAIVAMLEPAGAAANRNL